MEINAKLADNTDGNYRQFTVRLAIDNAIRATLKHPGDCLVITETCDAEGAPVEPRQVQIIVRQIVPKGWKLTTERDRSTGALNVWRLR